MIFLIHALLYALAFLGGLTILGGCVIAFFGGLLWCLKKIGL